jgi:hypothetical protein
MSGRVMVFERVRSLPMSVGSGAVLSQSTAVAAAVRSGSGWISFSTSADGEAGPGAVLDENDFSVL